MKVIWSLFGVVYLGIFLEFFEFIFDLNLLKTIKNDKKGVYFRVGPTWVRRGTQGHVTETCGPTRAPTWRGCDTWAIFIFTRII